MTDPGTGSALDATGFAVTGHPAVDTIMAALAESATAQPADQVIPLREAHRVLRETLDTIGDV